MSCETILLRHGDLAFSALDSGAGPVVLCLHGFPDHRGSWRFQLPALAAAGFRAVAPSLRGYEPQSQPRDGDYHLVRMAEDVIAWIDQLEQDQVHLVGHDWGALIGYATAALAPERLRSLTTLAVPHPGQMRHAGFRQVPGQLRNSWYIFFFQLRVIADLAVEARDWAFVEKLWRDWSPGWELPADELRAVKDSLSRPGVKRAALAYYRATFDFWSEANRQTSRLLESEMRVPTLGLTGARDGCMDTRMHDLAMSKQDFPAGLEVVRIEQAGHFLHQERPDEVNHILLDWLTHSEAAAPESTARDTNGGGR